MSSITTQAAVQTTTTTHSKSVTKKPTARLALNKCGQEVIRALYDLEEIANAARMAVTASNFKIEENDDYTPSGCFDLLLREVTAIGSRLRNRARKARAEGEERAANLVEDLLYWHESAKNLLEACGPHIGALNDPIMIPATQLVHHFIKEFRQQAEMRFPLVSQRHSEK